MNYGELKTLVGQYAKRTEADVGQFIAIAHSTISTEFYAPDSMDIANLAPGTLVSNSVYKFALPADVMRVRQVMADGNELVSSYAAMLFELRGSQAQWYAIEGLNLLVAPGLPGSVQVNYQKWLPALTAPADTNWVLSNFPQLYLYGALTELHSYVQDNEQVAVTQALYDKYAALAGQQMLELKTGGQPIIRSA